MNALNMELVCVQGKVGSSQSHLPNTQFSFDMSKEHVIDGCSTVVDGRIGWNGMLIINMSNRQVQA